MQGGRPPQPSGADSPSPSRRPRAPGGGLPAFLRLSRSVALCGPQGARPRIGSGAPPGSGARAPPPGRRPWQGRHTRSRTEPGSQGPERREYCGGSPWEGRAPPTGGRRSPRGGREGRAPRETAGPFPLCGAYRGARRPREVSSASLACFCYLLEQLIQSNWSNMHLALPQCA